MGDTRFFGLIPIPSSLSTGVSVLIAGVAGGMMGMSAPPFLKLKILKVFQPMLECFMIQDLPVNLSFAQGFAA